MNYLLNTRFIEELLDTHSGTETKSQRFSESTTVINASASQAMCFVDVRSTSIVLESREGGKVRGNNLQPIKRRNLEMLRIDGHVGHVTIKGEGEGGSLHEF